MKINTKGKRRPSKSAISRNRRKGLRPRRNKKSKSKVSIFRSLKRALFGAGEKATLDFLDQMILKKRP